MIEKESHGGETDQTAARGPDLDEQGLKAYVAGGKNRVEINGHRVCTTDTMDSLERAGLVTRLGVGAWEPTEAARQWTDSDVS